MLGTVLVMFGLAGPTVLPDRVPEIRLLRMRVMNYEIADVQRVLDAMTATRDAAGEALRSEYKFTKRDEVNIITGEITRKDQP